MKVCLISSASRLDYREGRADSRTSARIHQHLEGGCAACRTDMEWFGTFMPALQASLSEEAPSVSKRALEFAYALMPSPAAEPTRSSRRILTARLIFDSLRPAGQLAYVREAPGSSVHAVYRADQIDIDVWQEKAGDRRWVLIGQALPVGEAVLTAPQQVSLLLTSGVPQSEPQQAVLEDGEFTFDAVAGGEYTLWLQWEDQEILVTELIVGGGERV